MIKALLIGVLCGSTAAGIVSAQPLPKLASLSREWFQRGTTNELVLAGENLQGAQAVHVSGQPGLSVTLVPPDLTEIAVKVESSARDLSGQSAG